MSNNLYCVIPARGGSKRLPKKNILEMANKPMIAYSIEAAQKVKGIDTVYVATDNEEIADISKQFGAKVPFLMPDELCDDKVPSHKPGQHLIESISSAADPEGTLLLLQPTSPLRIPSDIKSGLDTHVEENGNFTLSVTHIDPHYFHWAMKEGDDGNWQMHFGDKYLDERPLLPDRYRPNGSIKIANLPALREEGNFFGENCNAFETPRRRSIHVGTQFEFDLAESLLERRESKWGNNDS